MAAGLGYKTFTTGEVLTAADTNGYLMQGLLVFASAAARDAAITSPQEGQACYLKDTDAVLTYSGTAWVGFDDSNAIQNSIVDAKGDIVAASGNDTPARLAVGNNGETLVANSSTATGLAYQPHIEAGKNFAINGGMDIWQRGTSSSGNAYNADRFYSALVSGTGTFAQETTVIPTGSLYSQKFTASATAQPALYQAVETLNAVKLQGQTVVLSALVAASTSTGITLDVQQSSSTDVAVTGSFTSITATSGGTATPTSTTFVPITGVYAIPSTAKSLRIRIFTTSTIASSVVVYFANIQMEVGSIATAFSRVGGTIQGELAACQRYYFETGTRAFRTFAVSQFWNTADGAAFIALPVTMRQNPSVSASAGTDFEVYGAAGAAVSLTAISFGEQSRDGFTANLTTAVSSMVANQAAILRSKSAGAATMKVSAEL